MNFLSSSPKNWGSKLFFLHQTVNWNFEWIINVFIWKLYLVNVKSNCHLDSCFDRSSHPPFAYFSARSRRPSELGWRLSWPRRTVWSARPISAARPRTAASLSCVRLRTPDIYCRSCTGCWARWTFSDRGCWRNCPWLRRGPPGMHE